MYCYGGCCHRVVPLLRETCACVWCYGKILSHGQCRFSNSANRCHRAAALLFLIGKLGHWRDGRVVHQLLFPCDFILECFTTCLSFHIVELDDIVLRRAKNKLAPAPPNTILAPLSSCDSSTHSFNTTRRYFSGTITSICSTCHNLWRPNDSRGLSSLTFDNRTRHEVVNLEHSHT